jgi:hypothetical protein
MTDPAVPHQEEESAGVDGTERRGPFPATLRTTRERDTFQADGAVPTGEGLRAQAERYLAQRGRGGNDHIRAYTYLDTLAVMESFAAHVLAAGTRTAPPEPEP